MADNVRGERSGGQAVHVHAVDAAHQSGVVELGIGGDGLVETRVDLVLLGHAGALGEHDVVQVESPHVAG
jgi:hypothetical protein